MLQHMFCMTFEDKNGISIVFDTDKSIIHVMEMDDGKNETIGLHLDEIQPLIRQRLEQFISPQSRLRWFVYDLHGRTGQYSDGVFEEIALSHPEINQKFAGKMKLRQMIAHKNG